MDHGKQMEGEDGIFGYGEVIDESSDKQQTVYNSGLTQQEPRNMLAGRDKQSLRGREQHRR